MRIARNQAESHQSLPTSILGRLRGLSGIGHLHPAARIGILLLVFFLGGVVIGDGYLIEITNVARGSVKQAIRILRAETFRYVGHEIPTLYVDMAFEDYQKILEKRAEALRVGILLSSDDDFVPARVRYQDGKSVSVEMRLKGDWLDHLEGEKWSYRIHVRNGDQVDGLRRFSIQAPETRQWLNEWAFHQALRREGILTTRYMFVDMVFNGESKGIYALEEGFSGELLEAQGRREGAIVRFDEDLWWRNRGRFMAQGWGLYTAAANMGFFIDTSLSTADLDVMREGRIAADPVLAAQSQTALGLLRSVQTGRRSVSEVYDVDQMGRFLALSDLWGASHSVQWSNMRFYLNPITVKLEPIGFDAMPTPRPDAKQPGYPFLGPSYPLFDDPVIRIAYARALERFSQPEYLAVFQTEIQSELEILLRALRWEYFSLEFPWEDLRSRQHMIGAQLVPAQGVRGTFWRTEARSEEEENSLRIDLLNLMVLPLELVAFRIDGQLVEPRGEWLTPDTSGNLMHNAEPITMLPINLLSGHLLAPLDAQDGTARLHVWGYTDQPTREILGDIHQETTFVIPLEEIYGALEDVDATRTVDVVVRLAGLTDEHTIALMNEEAIAPLSSGPMPDFPTVEGALSEHGFLRALGDGYSMEVEPGDWNVKGDLILPLGVELVVPQGTTLRFQEGAILLTTGSVTVMGTEHEPVVLTAMRDGWSGVVVLEASKDSVWKHVLVEKTQGVERGGWIVTGGITFFASPVTLDHVQVLNSQAEDAINIIHGTYEMRDSEFAFSASDAFDGDFTTGTIVHCSFHDIAGDAIDISGSDLKASFTTIVNVDDKALSVGEKSTVEAINLRIEDVGIGVASKDLSRVSLNHTTISGAKHTALAAFTKKAEYGPAYIEAVNLVMDKSDIDAMVQTDSVVIVNGETLVTIDLDIDNLYDQGILGN